MMYNVYHNALVEETAWQTQSTIHMWGFFLLGFKIYKHFVKHSLVALESCD